MKYKLEIIAAIALVAAVIIYILIFNAVRDNNAEEAVPVFNMNYNGDDVIYAGDNDSGSAKLPGTTNTITAFSSVAQKENSQTENAYTSNAQDDNSQTETAYENASKPLINLNTATVDELMNLDGVGEVTANRIIEYRNTYGFRSVDDLLNVKGIGEKKLANIKPFVCV